MKILIKTFANYLVPAMLITVLCNCKKDDSIILTPDSANSKIATNSLRSNAIAASNLNYVSSSSYYIEKALPVGYVKDGSRDYTTVIQEAILRYPNIVFPAFPILINDSGLDVPSSRTITFLEGSELRMKPTAKDGYGILKMRNATNVTLVNPVLKGDRYKHLGTTGEYGMGICVYGGSNITILSPIAKEMWGDGIYIGIESGVIPKTINIKNAVLEYNRRDGITIAAVDGLKLESPRAAFSNGTKPMAGIAFEPNNNTQEVKNVIITNPTTESNAGAGIFADFGNLLGNGQKVIGVTVYNHTDLKSYWGLKAMSRIDAGSSTIKGDLKFVNPRWSQNPFKALSTALYGVDDVHLVVEDPIIRNTSNYQLTKSETLSYMLNKLQINPSAWSNITFSSTWPNITTTTTTTTSTPVLAYAINAGGSSFTASNGITYQADKNFSGGTTYSTTNTINNTADDKLYQSERKGTFSYALPVSNGTYEITLRFAELYFSSAGSRRFDTLIEGVELDSNLDLYAVAGKYSAYNVVKTVNVTDGTLNINFHNDINNAKLAAFHIYKK